MEQSFAENPQFRLADALVRFKDAQPGDIVALALPFHPGDRLWQVDFLRVQPDGSILQVPLGNLDRASAARVAPAALALTSSAETWALIDETSSVIGRDQSPHLAVLCAEAMLIVPFDEEDYDDWVSNSWFDSERARAAWINMLFVAEPSSNHAALRAIPQIEALLEWHNARIAHHLDAEHAEAFRFDPEIFHLKDMQ